MGHASGLYFSKSFEKERDSVLKERDSVRQAVPVHRIIHINGLRQEDFERILVGTKVQTQVQNRDVVLEAVYVQRKKTCLQRQKEFDWGMYQCVRHAWTAAVA
jgi:hypothetical protein